MTPPFVATHTNTLKKQSLLIVLAWGRSQQKGKGEAIHGKGPMDMSQDYSDLQLTAQASFVPGIGTQRAFQRQALCRYDAVH